MLVCKANELRVSAPRNRGDLLPVNTGPSGVSASVKTKNFSFVASLYRLA